VPKLGVILGPEQDVAESSRRLESLGFDYVTVGEHVAFHRPASNAFVSLAIAAGATSRIGLVSGITLLPLYPAALAAKMAGELARLSGGRFSLGVGAGGEFAAEFEACGVPVGQRHARTDEALIVMRRLWQEEHVTFEGRFTTIHDLTLAPRPPSPPDVWVGGRGERAMRRAAAQGDVWMPYLYSPRRLRESVETVTAAAEQAGRDPASIGVAIYVTVALAASRDEGVARAAESLGRTYATDMSAAAARYVVGGSIVECVEQLRAYVEAGADRLIIGFLGDSEGYWDRVEQFAAEAMPALGT